MEINDEPLRDDRKPRIYVAALSLRDYLDW